MSDMSWQQPQPSGQEQSAETRPLEPFFPRTLFHELRIFLGKRKAEDNNSTLTTGAPRIPNTPESMTVNFTNQVPLAKTIFTRNPENPIPFDTNDEVGFAQSFPNSESSSGKNGPSRFDQDDIMEYDVISGDGTVEKNRRWKQQQQPIAAIFIHAGAGYHSTANENHHLKACSEAAMASMKVLKRGRSAVEAVEAAIRVLEDKEITNAGYGSNLAIDGTVECDATLVDHFGRSGACGAVPNIKNPIVLARAVLESSNKPLSLRRVPPNLLVGDGARDFAQDMGMLLVPNEALISKNARDRFLQWRDDLRRAEGVKEASTILLSRGETPPQYDPDARKDHTNAILTGTWNEGQPDSPVGSSPSPWPSPLPNGKSPTVSVPPQSSSPRAGLERSPLSLLGSSISAKRQRFFRNRSDECMNEYESGYMPETKGPTTKATYLSPNSHDGASDEQNAELREDLPVDTEDQITDTVGAIAIDRQGNIAAGSSSGGIGMKHRGRVGPAALVGVSTAVVPVSADDPEGITVAAVTSGTGEHMATTMASQRCAERIYQGNIRGAQGRDVPEDDENLILSSFITKDFLGHPGVRESSSTGAIGAMAVKKAPGGYYLYFAHNTESFALASMGSNDVGPSCVMSRLNEGGNLIAQGARKIHI